MSKISSQNDFSKVQDLGELVRYLSAYINELTPIINGRLQFDDNIQSQTVTTYFSAADTDLAIVHKLGKTGVGFFTIGKTAATDIYNGIGTDTTNIIYLRSSVAGVTVTLKLI